MTSDAAARAQTSSNEAGRSSLQLLRSLNSFARDIAATRDAFENWPTVGLVAGFGGPSRIPPREGIPWLRERPLTLVTRTGATFKTTAANAWPIIEVFRDGQYEAPLNWRDARSVIDVGGHVGAFTVWAAWRAPQARVTTFEPEPRNARELRQNVERNGLSYRVDIIQAAAGASDERRSFTVPAFRHASSFADSDTSDSVAIEVECVALERFLSEHAEAQIDVLKLDCEGAEWEILASLSDQVSGRIQHLLMECHARDSAEFAAMARLLTKRGFTPSLHATSAVTGKHNVSGPFRFTATFWASRR
jgi:FkbM family methyltransferase